MELEVEAFLAGRAGLKHRGLSVAPKSAVGDGALGFWKALDEVFPGPRHQGGWLHKVMTILDKVPTSVRGRMKIDLREIPAAPTRAAAEKLLLKVVAGATVKDGTEVADVPENRAA